MHFENEFLQVDLALEPGCVVKASVKALPPTVAEAHKQAINAVRKEVTLPGFRKGKVPENLLFTHFSKAIDQEWRDALLNLSFQKTMELTKKHPIRSSADKIQSKIISLKGPSEPAELSFQFESFPSVPSFELEKLTVSVPEYRDVSEEEIDEVIKTAGHSLATWEEITDHAAEKEDFIRLDMVELEDTETSVLTDRRLQVNDKNMALWLLDLVVGMKTGESREGLSVPEQSLDKTIDQELKPLFKPMRYRITLKAIEKPVSPPVDEDFAKKLGAQNVAQMREVIGKQLKAKKEHERKTAVIEALEEALFEQYHFDLPASLVKNDTLSFARSKEQTLRAHGHLNDEELAKHRETILSLSEIKKLI